MREISLFTLIFRIFKEALSNKILFKSKTLKYSLGVREIFFGSEILWQNGEKLQLKRIFAKTQLKWSPCLLLGCYEESELH